MQDRSFDGLSDRFEQRIYGSPKGRIRETLLWSQLQSHLPLAQHSAIDVLDAAGGLGQMTERCAALGHSVTLNDISGEMIDKARVRLAQYPNVEYSIGPVQALDQSKRYPLILCHALLEWLAEPESVVELLVGMLAPKGKLSLAFYNRHALVINNALKGNAAYLVPNDHARKPKRKGLSPPNAQFPETVLQWLSKQPVKIVGHYGVRVLSDWLPSELEITDQQLIDIERQYNTREPYRSMGRYVHLIIERQ